MATPPLLALSDIQLTFGGTPLLEGAGLELRPRERLCVVGRNGSGKSTLLKIAAGLVEPDGGERFLQPGTTVRYLPQEPDLSGFATVRDYALAGLNEGDEAYRVDVLLEGLGLTGQEGTDRLSGGEARRAALARTLAPEPDILMLDEPTNHLDLPAIEWLEETLAQTRSALVLISHDRRFLANLSQATLWIDRGQSRRLEEGFSAFEAWRDEVLAAEELEAHKLTQEIRREEHWVRYGVTARRKRNVRRMRELGDLRGKRSAMKQRAQKSLNTLEAQASEASGKSVIRARKISKAYGAREIVKDLTIEIERGDRLGIVGPNGAGKTTLLNLLCGQLEPDSGTVKLGTNLDTILLDQRRADLKEDDTVSYVLTEGRGDTVMVGDTPRHVIGYLKDFLFTPDQARQPVAALSGGERGRLLLARALARRSNLLLLDEPTNDLDLETLDLLQEMLADYPGTLILISHDRDFLDRVVTSTLMHEGGGTWREYAGGYSDMIAQRGRGIDARTLSAPTRPKGSAKPKPAPAPAKAERPKLGFRETHELNTLPERIAALEAKIARVNEILADPDLYTTDAARFEKATNGLTQLQDELEAAEMRWLELEELREAG